MRLVDSHCHLQADRFDDDADAVIGAARRAGVERILVPGWNVASSERALDLVARHAWLDAAAGIHPHDAARVGEAAYARIEELAADERVVAIGETGIDYDRLFLPVEAQLANLRRHLALALATGKPLILHCRSAAGRRDAQDALLDDSARQASAGALLVPSSAVAAQDAEEPEVRRAALWQAAELYRSSGDATSAARVYADYVKRYPAPFDVALEARHELADLATTTGNPAARQKWLQEIVSADAAAGAARTDRSRFLAANAALELARPLDSAARAIRLAIPLDKSLRAKRKAMEAALGAYGKVEEYGVAQVSTAATYAMADLYRHLGKALLDSERPRKLSAEELEQYDILLEEQAFPFEEKAIDIHARNTRRAVEGTWDLWIEKSYEDLAVMQPGR